MAGYYSRASDFGLELQEMVKRLKGNADIAVRQILFGVARSIDEKSPVGDPDYWKGPAPKNYIGGHFRANWQLGINQRPTSIIPGEDKGGQQTQANIVAAVPRPSYGPTYYLVNNVPYAQRLEDGWSWRQAPKGMVHITIIEYQRIVNQALAEAKFS